VTGFLRQWHSVMRGATDGGFMALHCDPELFTEANGLKLCDWCEEQIFPGESCVHVHSDDQDASLTEWWHGDCWREAK